MSWFRFHCFLLTFFCLPIVFPQGAYAFTMPDEALLASTYQDGEILRYSITWLGIKAGELRMGIKKLPEGAARYGIEVVARSAGLLAVFYPVEDRFETIVEGRARLPVSLRMEQKEGRRRNSKLTTYDQQNFIVRYTKNDQKPQRYTVSGPVHNEFSSFFYLRALPLRPETPAIVPTFADEKRHEVPVFFEGRKTVDSLFGKVESLEVRPHLTFKGLYEKMGDPLIWLSDDAFRIPLRIKARIVIGSLTARLVAYHGARGSFGKGLGPSEPIGTGAGSVR